MKEGNTERYRAPLWPDVKSRWCVRHMKANFHNQFKNKTLAKLFEQLCEQTQQKKFDAIWKKLYELTKNTSEEIAKRLVNLEPGEESISLEDVG
jgi:flavorubredoxin